VENPDRRRAMGALAEGPRRRPHHQLTMALTVESCHRLDLKRLFRSGRIGPGWTGSWRGQRWRIDGPFLEMSGARRRLVPMPRKNVRGVQGLLQDATGRRCTSLLT
jgi:hypothetical protein